jgi:hypothetical protein
MDYQSHGLVLYVVDNDRFEGILNLKDSIEVTVSKVTEGS